MDADPETLEQLQTTLRREGYNVFVAADGHAALRRAQQHRPDLIVSDLLLAGLDGYQVWRTLRTDKSRGVIPVLVVSALTIPPSNEPWRPNLNADWQFLSYDAYLPKPVDLGRFIRVVKKLLHPDQAGTIPGGPSVVLAIEATDLRNQLADILSSHNFGVEAPPSLAEAIQLTPAITPAALILDYRQPNETIKNVILQIKKSVPNLVVLLTVDLTRPLEAGLENLADCFLSVPIQPDLSVMMLNRVLELDGLRRRIKAISSQLIVTDHDLLDTQQAIRAQNEELQYVNNQLRELGQLKETLTGMIVHDLKAPLGAILGAINFLITDPDLDLSSTHARLLTAATAAGNQMLRLTETLLEGQRLEDGHLKPDIEPVDLPTIIDIGLHQVSPLLTMQQLNVECVFSPNLPLVYADPHLSQRVLENLLDNAIKFSPSGSTITISTIVTDQVVKVSVADIGPGIPQDRQKDIFDRFAQIKNAASRTARRGFGLGLTFCNLAVQAMGGEIWVESDGESGTTFIFTLPIFKDEIIPDTPLL
jgi:signal transduction histidine kinase